MKLLYTCTIFLVNIFIVFLFVSTDVSAALADVNSDEYINSADASLILQKSVDLDMSSTAWSGDSTGDVNCDDVTSSVDALLTLRHAENLDVTWCGAFDSCVLDGITVLHGNSHDFFNIISVAHDQTCDSHEQVRTCNNGTLSGDNEYQYSTCTVAQQPKDCYINGITVPNGSSHDFYSTRWVSSFQSTTCNNYKQSRVCSNGVLSGTYQFNECTKTSAQNLMKFVVIGDSRSDAEDVGSRLQLVIDQIRNSWGVGSPKSLPSSLAQFMISTGDIYDPYRYPGTTNRTSNSLAQVAPLAEYRDAQLLWNAIGNHEYYGDSDGSIYDNIFTYYNRTGDSNGYKKRYYDIKKGPIHFFFLDPNKEYFSIRYDGSTLAAPELDVQKEWLKQKLQESTSVWKVVVFHYPNFENTNAEDQIMNWDWYGMGIDVVLTGHVHAYVRYNDKHGVAYYINGSGGSEMNGNACNASNPWFLNQVRASRDEYGRALEPTVGECIDWDNSAYDIYGYQRINADERYMDFTFQSFEGYRNSLDHDIIYSSNTKGVRDNQRKTDLQAIAIALKKHYAQHGSYTQPETAYYDCSTGVFGSEGCGEGDGWSANSDLQVLVNEGYIAELPVDPINSSLYRYNYEVNGTIQGCSFNGCSYILCASNLEMNGDQYCITAELGGDEHAL